MNLIVVPRSTLTNEVPQSEPPTPAPPAGRGRRRSHRQAGELAMRAIRTHVRMEIGNSVRADLEVALDAGPGEGRIHPPRNGAMLRNILGLHERRIADMMMPRADIVAVKRDISIGELIRTFRKCCPFASRGL